jgi:hypothetical protein
VLLPVSLGLPGQALQRTARQYSACWLHLSTGHSFHISYQCCGSGFIEFVNSDTDPDPDPVRIQVLDNQKLKKRKKTAEFFLYQKTGSIGINRKGII